MRIEGLMVALVARTEQDNVPLDKLWRQIKQLEVYCKVATSVTVDVLDVYSVGPKLIALIASAQA